MDYESVSGIIIVVMLVIAMVGWLPKRTVDGMKRVIEHREDKFSSSLHLVDGDSGTRFSDVRGPLRKGAAMQHTHVQDSALDMRRIARIRAMRRAAARRRSILAAVLLVVTVIVTALALMVPFNMWFAAIPAVSLAVVLGMGVRVARHARRWERTIARQRTRPAGVESAGVNAVRHAAVSAATASAGMKPPTSISSVSKTTDSRTTDGEARDRIDDVEVRSHKSGEMPTGVMEQREIRRALRQSRDERDRALARRRHEAEDTAESAASVTAARPSVELSVEQSLSTSGAMPISDAVDADATASDATDELGTVHASHALEAFDMAAQQDLISFSLGSSHNHEQVVSTEPESREIKSTRQVAQALPVASDGSAGDADPAQDVRAFHEREVDSDIDVPEPTSESLGADLEAVLARRASDKPCHA